MSPILLRLRALLPWDTFACHQLGAMLATGDGAPKNERAALRWYRRGARRGDPESQYDLGLMLLFGEGCKADREEAVRWLTIAAQGGHDTAARFLAQLAEDEKTDDRAGQLLEPSSR